jgi:hypothetical protein
MQLPLIIVEASRLDSISAVFYAQNTMTFLCVGFSFVFCGSIAAPKPRRGVAGTALIILGICLLFLMSGDDVDNIGSGAIFVCYLLASIVGGLLALALEPIRQRFGRLIGGDL